MELGIAQAEAEWKQRVFIVFVVTAIADENSFGIALDGKADSRRLAELRGSRQRSVRPLRKTATS